MRDEYVGVLDAFSDVSESSESDEELYHVLDPSNPRAHRQELSVVQPTRVQATKTSRNQMSSRWDTDDDVGAPIKINLGAKNQIIETPIVIDDDDGTKTPKQKAGVTLSKWAQARFLVPACQRKLPVFEEPPLEPINDFILSDFSSRYRGGTGDVKVEKKITAEEKEEHNISSKMHVGVPLFGLKSIHTDKANGSKDRDRVKDNPGKKMNKEDGRKRKENRYFVTDLATKCNHCGELGHIAGVCLNDKLEKPCYYCALRGHQAWECPNLPCTNCLQLGHQENDCINRTININLCSICGRKEHNNGCDNVGDPAGVTCMVCTKVGHLHCVPMPPPADRSVYCPHCSKNHTLDKCRTYREPAATNFAARMASGRNVQTCFVCNEPGHIAAECAMRTNGYNKRGGNCFKCGNVGHFAVDCYESSNDYRNNGRRVSSHKRKRDVEDEYPHYNGYDYDEDESYYSHDRTSKGGKKSHNRGVSSRSTTNSTNRGYAHLNEALPTRPYRSNNSYEERRRHSSRR